LPDYHDIAGTLVIAPNFKKRLSGVTSTIVALVPKQRAMGIKIAALAPDGLPDIVPRVLFRDLWKLWQTPANAKARVWHARRNTEMLPGILMRDILRMPLKLVFTSAAQRDHSGYTKWLIRRMDAVIATSTQAASYLQVPHTIIMHGIDTARFSPPVDKAAAKRAVGLDPSKKVIGCFGRIRHQKGTDRFVDAMIAAMPSNPDWIAIITGRVTAEHQGFADAMHAKIAAAGLKDRFLFPGEVDDVRPWYQALDLFAAPQRWEGFGLTPLEAMACGVPVIATPVGAFPDLVKNDLTGLVTANDDAAYNAAVAALLPDDKRREQMASACRLHIGQNFMLEREAGDINAIYDRLLQA
jgi:mannosyltransferase